MTSLDWTSLLRGSIPVETYREASATEKAAKPGTALEGQRSADNRVNLSDTGRILSKSTQNKDADIDKSDLPDLIKHALKRIRGIREALQKKLQELQAAMSDKKLTEDQRKARIQGLQSEVAALSAALTFASAALAKLMDDTTLTTEQAVTVVKFFMT